MCGVTFCSGEVWARDARGEVEGWMVVGDVNVEGIEE